MTLSRLLTYLTVLRSSVFDPAFATSSEFSSNIFPSIILFDPEMVTFSTDTNQFFAACRLTYQKRYSIDHGIIDRMKNVNESAENGVEIF